jgi:hypothetical protein
MALNLITPASPLPKLREQMASVPCLYFFPFAHVPSFDVQALISSAIYFFRGLFPTTPKFSSLHSHFILLDIKRIRVSPAGSGQKRKTTGYILEEKFLIPEGRYILVYMYVSYTDDLHQGCSTIALE